MKLFKKSILLFSIDIFSKFISIVPIQTKNTPEILGAIMQILNKVGKPKIIYTDNEGSWSAGTEIDKYFREEHIKHIITLSHPNVSERAIRIKYISELKHHLEQIGQNYYIL